MPIFDMFYYKYAYFQLFVSELIFHYNIIIKSIKDNVIIIAIEISKLLTITTVIK